MSLPLASLKLLPISRFAFPTPMRFASACVFFLFTSAYSLLAQTSNLWLPGASVSSAEAVSLASRVPVKRRTLGTSANATWHSLNFRLPSSSSQHFTSLSGTLYPPTDLTPRRAGSSYYLWPGLQPDDGAGVLQNVLDGRDPRQWYIASGWCCHNPELPWGEKIWPNPGQGVRFQNRLSRKKWSTELQLVDGNQTLVSESFGIGTESSLLKPFVSLESHKLTHDRKSYHDPCTFRD